MRMYITCHTSCYTCYTSCYTCYTCYTSCYTCYTSCYTCYTSCYTCYTEDDLLIERSSVSPYIVMRSRVGRFAFSALQSQKPRSISTFHHIPPCPTS